MGDSTLVLGEGPWPAGVPVCVVPESPAVWCCTAPPALRNAHSTAQQAGAAARVSCVHRSKKPGQVGAGLAELAAWASSEGTLPSQRGLPCSVCVGRPGVADAAHAAWPPVAAADC